MADSPRAAGRRKRVHGPVMENPLVDGPAAFTAGDCTALFHFPPTERKPRRRPIARVCDLRQAQMPARRDEVQHAQEAEAREVRSEKHTSELQSQMTISYAVFCLKNKKNIH